MKYIVAEFGPPIPVPPHVTAPQKNGADVLRLGHLASVLAVAVFLLGVSWMKNPEIFSVFSKKSAPRLYTYEQAVAETSGSSMLAENSSAANEDVTEQLAQADPAIGEGRVLGASTGTEDSVVPQAEQMLTPEILNQIKVREISTSSPQAVKNYFEELSNVSYENGLAEVMTYISGSGNDTPAVMEEKVQKLVQAILAIEVPTPVVKYQKVNILYIAQLRQMILANAGNTDAGSAEDIGMSILSLNNYLEQLKADLLQKYQTTF